MMEVPPPPLYGYTEAQAAAIYPALAARRDGSRRGAGQLFAASTFDW